MELPTVWSLRSLSGGAKGGPHDSHSMIYRRCSVHIQQCMQYIICTLCSVYIYTRECKCLRGTLFPGCCCFLQMVVASNLVVNQCQGLNNGRRKSRSSSPMTRRPLERKLENQVTIQAPALTKWGEHPAVKAFPSVSLFQQTQEGTLGHTQLSGGEVV